MDSRPPCARLGERLNPCAVALLEFHEYGNAWLGGNWRGWRIVRGRLQSPDGLRITPEQLGALMASRSGLAGRDGGGGNDGGARPRRAPKWER